MVNILGKWAQHRPTQKDDDNVAQWGSYAIEKLARGDPDSKARWLAAGVEGVLRDIADEGTSGASDRAKTEARGWAYKHEQQQGQADPTPPYCLKAKLKYTLHLLSKFVLCFNKCKL